MDFNAGDFSSKIFESKIINFDELALQLFKYQFEQNLIYNQFCEKITPIRKIDSLKNIPFLPIEFFKTHEIKSDRFTPEIIFKSSGTTGMSYSNHYVKDLSIYEKCYHKAFDQFYGKANEYCIIALLPSYLERDGSSLVYMFEDLIKQSEHPLSDFYLHDFEKLNSTLTQLKAQKQKTILVGVTYALLDFAEKHHITFPELIVMETGGMKGRKKEMLREEIHAVLKQSFSVSNIHSEYGMTELLSQAYSKCDGKFICPPWMKIVITDTNDPFQILPTEKTGIINVIDLANIHSCAFIKTSDLGKINQDNTFEILGRLDNSDMRGCSLLYF